LVPQSTSRTPNPTSGLLTNYHVRRTTYPNRAHISGERHAGFAQYVVGEKLINRLSYSWRFVVLDFAVALEVLYLRGDVIVAACVDASLVIVERATSNGRDACGSVPVVCCLRIFCKYWLCFPQIENFEKLVRKP